MSVAPARFSPISANPLPAAVKVGGTIYGVGPLNSPSGEGWLPADLLAGYNLAHAHIRMAVRLLEMTKGLQPQECKRLADETRMEPDGPGRWVGIPNDLANLAHEIICQNGAEVITALFEQLSRANTTGGPIRAGRVEERNGHAAAYAAAHQLANEVLNGEPLSITAADLERLDQLVCAEACAVADQRSGTRAVPTGEPVGLATGSTQARAAHPAVPVSVTRKADEQMLRNIEQEIDRWLFAHVKRCRCVDQASFVGVVLEPMRDDEVRAFVAAHYRELWEKVLPERLKREHAEAQARLGTGSVENQRGQKISENRSTASPHVTENAPEKAPRHKVFISYSHKDTKFLDQLLVHLKPLEHAGLVTKWSDKQIVPSSQWFAEIQAALASTRVAVMMVTPSFLASDFIHEHELGPLLREAEKGGVRILWIPVRACSYKETPLKNYQAVSDPDKPLAQMKAERDGAWVRVCAEIKKALSP